MNKEETLLVQFEKCLGNMLVWFDKAEAHANAKKFDVAILLGARLAPDMFPLVKQVQAACDAAKYLAARLSGTDAPRHPDTEASFDELRARIESVRDYLRTFDDGSFAGAQARTIALPFWPGKGMAAREYLTSMAAPNFYFHYSMAYAILRHNGVDVGKQDYIGVLATVDL